MTNMQTKDLRKGDILIQKSGECIAIMQVTGAVGEKTAFLRTEISKGSRFFGGYSACIEEGNPNGIPGWILIRKAL